jgi:hypothetical protein
LADSMLHYPLTEKTVHLCVDMQRLFSAEGLWPTPWMERVLPVVRELAERFPERTVFTRFITPNRASEMPGMWQCYYTRWREATRECIDPGLLELLPPLAQLRSRLEKSNERKRRVLLRARSERPRRAAQCRQQSPPCNDGCHMPLPHEGAETTIARRGHAVSGSLLRRLGDSDVCPDRGFGSNAVGGGCDQWRRPDGGKGGAVNHPNGRGGGHRSRQIRFGCKPQSTGRHVIAVSVFTTTISAPGKAGAIQR